MDENLEEISKNNILYMPQRPAVEIEFQDLTYTVPQGRKGERTINPNFTFLIQGLKTRMIRGFLLNNSLLFVK